MTLLAEVIDGAAGDAPVATLLRKLKIVASRSGSGRLAEWVERELSGYPDRAELPEYRGPFAVVVLGHFLGPFNAELQNIKIPVLTFPEEMRSSSLFTHYILGPIAEVEVLSKRDIVSHAWSGDAVMYYNFAVGKSDVRRIVHEGFWLVSATCPIPGTLYLGAVDGVRNRALDLALALEREAPEAGQPDAGADTNRKVEQVVNNFNFHGPANVAVDSHHFKQTIELPSEGDLDSLIAYLTSHGVPATTLADLREAGTADLAEDHADGQPGRWGRVRAWLAAATTDVGTGSAAVVMGTAASAFLGH